MTYPPYDGDERGGGPGGTRPDPDGNLTQPVQFYDRPAPSAGPSLGRPGAGGPQPYGQPPSGRPSPYGRPPQDHPQPAQQPGPPPFPPPGYGPAPAQYGQPPFAQPQYGPPQYTQPGYGQPGYGQPGHGQPGHGQPGYGAPYGAPGQPYGTPYAGPPRKSKAGAVAGLTGLALLLVAVVVVAVLAMQSTVLDPTAVERDVAAQFEQREGVAIELSCDEEMEVDEGDSYRCTGVTADGEEVTLQITITDEDTAAYTWTEP